MKFSALVTVPVVGLLLLCNSSASAQTHPVITAPRNEHEAMENEGRLEAERYKYFEDRLTSSQIKDPLTIRETAYQAYLKLGSTDAFKQASTTDWTSISPSSGPHVCGRLRSIAFDPTNSKIAYVGAAQGGIWKTTDITANPVKWTYLSDKFPTLVFGSIAVDPKHSNIVYASTGETHPGYVKTDGFGVYKSTDAGLNWTQIASSAEVGTTSAQIAIDPVNTDNLYIATGGFYGLVQSRDGGATWFATLNQLAFGSALSPVSIAIDPKSPAIVYVGTQEGNIFRTTDGGNNWRQAITGLPFDSIGVVLVAVAPSSSGVVYASFGNGISETALGIWRSQDFGSTWTNMNLTQNFSMADTNYLGEQQFYASALAVNPTNPNEIVVGGLNTYFSIDGGATLINGSAWEADQTDPRYSHADVHDAVYQGNLLYLCTDGGLSVTADRGNHWTTSLSNGIDAFQFVGIDASPSFSFVAGGLQDNGVQRTSNYAGNWAQTRGGDGGLTRVPQLNGNVVYSTYYGPTLTRSTDGGQTWHQDAQGDLSLVTNKDFQQEGSLFYAPMDVSPDGTVVVMGGKHHVFVSTDGGFDGLAQESIQDLNPQNGTGPISYVYVFPGNSSEMLAGSNGLLFGSTDRGLNWGAVSLPTTGTLVGVVANTDASKLFEIQGGLAVDQNLSFGESTDHGATWSNPATNLPQIPFNSIARASDGTLFIGTDYTVLTSKDNGVTWSKLGTTLPPVQILSLQVRGTNDAYLLAGTHGRGAWYYPLQGISAPNQGGSGSGLSLDPPFPNRDDVFAPGVPIQVQYTLDRFRDYTLSVYDNAGRLMITIDKGSRSAGTYVSTIDPKQLAAGMYFIALVSQGDVLSQRLIIPASN